MFDTSKDIAEPLSEPKIAASHAGLKYVNDARPGIRRINAGKGFRYLKPDGTRLSDSQALRRIKALVIPAAWTEVWICPLADAHLQATGRDAKGRKQFQYHPLFREARETNKYEHMMAFAKALSGIRATIKKHMALRGLPREKILASVAYLLEATLIRIGSDDYAKKNKSYGLTTLKNRHVDIDGSEVRFRFTGKSGKQWTLKIKDRRIARIIRQCQELPGQELIQYVDDEGTVRDVTSTDVNAYLKEISGLDITAKDFRTWAGTVLAATALQELQAFDSAAQAKRNLRKAIERVASRLGNTVTICKKCYVHPEIIDLYLGGKLALHLQKKVDAVLRSELAELAPEEAAVYLVLRKRLERQAADAE